MNPNSDYYFSKKLEDIVKRTIKINKYNYPAGYYFLLEDEFENVSKITPDYLKYENIIISYDNVNNSLLSLIKYNENYEELLVRAMGIISYLTYSKYEMSHVMATLSSDLLVYFYSAKYYPLKDFNELELKMLEPYIDAYEIMDTWSMYLVGLIPTTKLIKPLSYYVKEIYEAKTGNEVYSFSGIHDNFTVHYLGWCKYADVFMTEGADVLCLTYEDISNGAINKDPLIHHFIKRGIRIEFEKDASKLFKISNYRNRIKDCTKTYLEASIDYFNELKKVKQRELKINEFEYPIEILRDRYKPAYRDVFEFYTNFYIDKLKKYYDE